MRRLFRLVLLMTCGIVGITAGPRRLLATDRPNILWLTAEDMSPTLGCWGDTYAITHHIDQLAQQGVRYTRAFATAPVCSPARSCLITGCYATSLGTQRLRSSFPIPRTMQGFPALLRKAGYYCTNNVKTDYNTSNEKAIIKASWDDNSATAHWRNRKDAQPFFSVFNDMTSHQSRTMVWPYEQFRKEVQSRLNPEEIHDPENAPVPPYYPDTPLVRKTVARYYDCVTVMDQNVGRLLKQLEEDGLAEDTIVFFYSDHGSGMPRHKRALLDSGMHVPLIVRFPEKYQHLAPAVAGETVDRLVSFVDFAPTLLSLLEIPIPQVMQGTPFLGAKSGPPRDYVYGARDRVDEVFDLARSVRNEHFLYIRNFMPHLSYHQPSGWPDAGAVRLEITEYVRRNEDTLPDALRHYAGPTRPVEELYDVQADPVNLKNLADSTEHEETLQRMRRAMDRWIIETRDCGFLPEADARERTASSTPFAVARDPDRYPLPEILKAASLVGMGEQTVDHLRRNLSNDDAAVRYWAAVGFSALRIPTVETHETLAKALKDPSPDVRIEAANALARMGDVDAALPVLVAALEDRKPSAVLHAARTIELLGKIALPAKPAMEAAIERKDGAGDQQFFVELSVEAFLRKIAN